MDMRQVNVGCIVRNGMLAIAVLTMCGARAAAQEGAPYAGPETQVTRLGGTTRFSPPMRNLDDLRSFVTTNRNELTRVFTMVDLAGISTQVLDALIAGNVTDTMVTPGTHMDWMALKRSGRPDVLRNVRWNGRNSFDAFQAKVSAGGYTYTFVVPKVCGNLSLVSRVATPMTRAPEPPPPPPAPEPPPLAAAPPPPPPPPPPVQTAVAIIEPTRDYWMASGFAGTNFSANTQNVDVLDIDDNGAATFSFGGQVGYLWKGIFGVSGLLDFSPSIDVQSLAFSGSPSVSAYMANVVIAYPIGAERQYQPYVSGGFGAIRMSADVVNFFIPETLQPSLDFTGVSQTKFGANIGAGLAAFLGGSRFGLLTDVRYFHAASDNTLADDVVLNDLLLDESLLGDELSETSRADAVIRRVLSGLGYWRANVGLAIRW